MKGTIEIAVAFPVVVTACLLLFYFYFFKVRQPKAGTTEWITREVGKTRFNFLIERHPMERRDILPVLIITAVFALLAFFRLGDLAVPQSGFLFTEKTGQITIELDEAEEISGVMYYTGLFTGWYTLELSPDGVNWQEQYPQDDHEYAMHQRYSHLYKWRNADINEDNLPTKYIRLTASKPPLQLTELALYDTDGELVAAPRISSPDAPELFDEQELVPEKATYMNSMYFDEIYHGRTAQEHLLTIAGGEGKPAELQAIYPYETTHPPLGKLIIVIGIQLFGMVPFGWRFMGTLFGVIMLPLFYVFLKNVFGRTPVAICGTLLFSFDFMRYVQTRIATIDTYGVIFILLAYYFMYRFITIPPDSKFRAHIVPLSFSGLFFGMGCASKWIVVYAGLGLAAIYIIRLVTLISYRKREKVPGHVRFIAGVLGWSVLVYCIIPVVIYCASYIPYGLAKQLSLADGMLWDKSFFKLILDNQKAMLSYHGKLEEGHSYGAPWWQWILNARPILYSSDYVGDMKYAFSAFGNPVVWWGGFMAMLCAALCAVKNRDTKALFIVIAFLSQILPWLLISRVVFIYHYFPSTLFLILATAYVFDSILRRDGKLGRRMVYGYTAAAGALFVMFLPALTGLYAPTWYFRYFLKWIPGMWPF